MIRAHDGCKKNGHRNTRLLAIGFLSVAVEDVFRADPRNANAPVF